MIVTDLQVQSRSVSSGIILREGEPHWFQLRILKFNFKMLSMFLFYLGIKYTKYRYKMMVTLCKVQSGIQVCMFLKKFRKDKFVKFEAKPAYFQFFICFELHKYLYRYGEEAEHRQWDSGGFYYPDNYASATAETYQSQTNKPRQAKKLPSPGVTRLEMRGDEGYSANQRGNSNKLLFTMSQEAEVG